jgi:hypothetical protein
LEPLEGGTVAAWELFRGAIRVVHFGLHLAAQKWDPELGQGNTEGKGSARLETVLGSPRGRRGRHVKKEGQGKRGTTRRSPRRSVHSEGISYKPLSDEIGMCLRVGRMGPIKR